MHRVSVVEISQCNGRRPSCRLSPIRVVKMPQARPSSLVRTTQRAFRVLFHVLFFQIHNEDTFSARMPAGFPNIYIHTPPSARIFDTT